MTRKQFEERNTAKGYTSAAKRSSHRDSAKRDVGEGRQKKNERDSPAEIRTPGTSFKGWCDNHYTTGEAVGPQCRPEIGFVTDPRLTLELACFVAV